MTVLRIIGAVIVCAAVVLLSVGIRSAGLQMDAARQGVSPQSNRPTWLLVAGVAGITLGGALTVMGRHDQEDQAPERTPDQEA